MSSTPDSPRATAQGSVTASPRRILLATLGALVAAVLILVVAVLPVEYGLDLIGAGRVLGLSALAETGAGAVSTQADSFKRDAVDFELAPFEAIEYKYRLAQGASMVFSWEATGPVVADFHAEPDGAAPGFAESFDRREAAAAHGTLVAPFAGIHGWYWQNTGTKNVTVRLTTAGFYTAGLEILESGTIEHTLTAPRGTTPAGAGVPTP